MSSTIDQFVRPNIRALQPYRSARQDHCSGILLDANENSFASAVTSEGLSLNRYPDPSQKQLRRQLAVLHHVEEDQVFVGVGSDEVIDLLLRIFCDPSRDNVIIPEPTYGMYRVAASIHGVEIRSCELTDAFQLDLPAIRNMTDERTRIIFSCSPNNPTGNLLHGEDLLALSEINAVVVVDEAYADFGDIESLGKETATKENLVVIRTLSKAWGLAAIRCGYAIAHPSVINWLMRVKSPYNMNALTAAVAMKALERGEHVQATIQQIREEREWLRRALGRLRTITTVFPSDANFLLVRCTDANRIYQELAARGVIIRNRTAEPKLANCVRVTVGTHEQNERLIDLWKDIAP